ncbi:MAG: hypothetical protein HY363_04330 [Candidatus Aenigmarchaeota archaeon]|nr:hypothetical protein [Candidatus Aenigmarchaeota archaeon]
MSRKRKDENNAPVIYVVLVIVFLLLGYSVYTLIGLFGAEQPVLPIQNVKPVQFKTISSGTTDNGDVSIELTPAGTKDGKLQINIVANTHSVDLSQFDLLQITSLIVGEKTIKPVVAPLLSGHHSSGIIEFEAGGIAAEFTVIIKGIPQIEERIFKW